MHVAITANDRAAVDAFYRAALAAGGKDNGAPGLRPQYHPNYYGAFVLDPDGHNIEAVCHARCLSRGTVSPGQPLAGMAEPQPTDRVWDIIEKVGVVHADDAFARGLRARPVEARPDRDARSDLVRHRPARRQGPRDRSRARYRADLHRRRATTPISRSPAAPRCCAIPPRPRKSGRRPTICGGAGRDDPNVCVLRVEPVTAELWDGPASKAVRGI